MADNVANEKSSGLLKVSSAPHIRSTDSIRIIMWTVVLALMPEVVYSVILFGRNALYLLITGIVTAIATEAAWQYVNKQKITALDGSAAITGLLLGMNLPPEAPIWLAGIGSAFAIFFVKQLFGGLGFNIFNPALAGRAFLMASWPVHMTTRWHHFSSNNVLAGGVENTLGIPHELFDTLTGATPLSLLKEGTRLVMESGIGVSKVHDLLLSPKMFKALFVGNVGGVIGETSALLLLVGGIILLVRRVITWHIPFSYIGTTAILFFTYYTVNGTPEAVEMMLFHLLAGSLFLGAFFMATDYTTSPATGVGMVIFGMGCGILTFVIRIWGGYPEGVSYAILIMNALTPLIDRWTRPKVFGTTN